MRKLAILLVAPVLALGITAAPAQAVTHSLKDTTWGCPGC